MSLVVLKRKAQTKYNKISSHGKGRFSLNNPRRVRIKKWKRARPNPNSYERKCP